MHLMVWNSSWNRVGVQFGICVSVFGFSFIAISNLVFFLLPILILLAGVLDDFRSIVVRGS
jgi:hypothetical protein